MSIGTTELIQLLQLIVLAFTAVVFISQFILRLFLSDQATESIRSLGGEKAINRLKSGAQSFFDSIAFFAISGSFVSIYLVLSAVPGEVDYILLLFESNQVIIGVCVLLFVITVSLMIRGDLDNPRTGVNALLMAPLLAGISSILAIMGYVVLWAATRSAAWVFFIGGFSLALAMTILLFASLVIAESIVDVVDNID